MNKYLQDCLEIDDGAALLAAIDAFAEPYLAQLNTILSEAGKQPLGEWNTRVFKDGFFYGFLSRAGRLSNVPVTTAPHSQAKRRRSAYWWRRWWEDYCDNKLAEEPTLLTDRDIRKRVAAGEEKWVEAKWEMGAVFSFGFNDGDFFGWELLTDDDFIPFTPEELVAERYWELPL